MAAAAILKKNWFNGYIPAAMAYICTKFYTGTKNHTPQAILPSKFNSRKIQDGGGRHFDNWFNVYSVSQKKSPPKGS